MCSRTFCRDRCGTSLGLSVFVDPGWPRPRQSIRVLPALIGTPPRVVLCGPASRPWWGSPSRSDSFDERPDQLPFSALAPGQDAGEYPHAGAQQQFDDGLLTGGEQERGLVPRPSTSGVDPSGNIGVGQFGGDVLARVFRRSEMCRW